MPPCKLSVLVFLQADKCHSDVNRKEAVDGIVANEAPGKCNIGVYITAYCVLLLQIMLSFFKPAPLNGSFISHYLTSVLGSF